MTRKAPHIPALFLVIGSTLIPMRAHAILDALADAAREAAKAAVYADAVKDVVSSVDDRSEVAEGAKVLNRKINDLGLAVGDSYYLSEDLKSSLTSHDWSSKSLDQNIQFTATFIGQMRKFLVSLGFIGTDVATAMNTAETNSALTEVLKNQQAQILISKENQIDQLTRETLEKKSWEDFISREHALRAGTSDNQTTSGFGYSSVDELPQSAKADPAQGRSNGQLWETVP